MSKIGFKRDTLEDSTTELIKPELETDLSDDVYIRLAIFVRAKKLAEQAVFEYFNNNEFQTDLIAQQILITKLRRIKQRFFAPE